MTRRGARDGAVVRLLAAVTAAVAASGVATAIALHRRPAPDPQASFWQPAPVAAREAGSPAHRSVEALARRADVVVRGSVVAVRDGRPVPLFNAPAKGTGPRVLVLTVRVDEVLAGQLPAGSRLPVEVPPFGYDERGLPTAPALFFLLLPPESPRVPDAAPSRQAAGGALVEPAAGVAQLVDPAGLVVQDRSTLFLPFATDPALLGDARRLDDLAARVRAAR